MPSPAALAPLPQFPSIPDPGSDVATLRATVAALKEAVELLTGQRGSRGQVEYSLQGTLQKLEGYGSEVYELNQISEGIASSLSLVQTQVNDVSAQAQVTIRAEANPSGYKAWFGVYLRAQADSSPGAERRAGMSIGLSTGNVSVTSFDTNKFLIRDTASGAIADVFVYSGGYFTFTGDVIINGSLLVNGTVTVTKIGTEAVTNPKIADNAVSSSTVQSTSGTNIQFGVACRAGAQLLIIAVSKISNGVRYGSGSAIGTQTITFNGVLRDSITNNYILDNFSVSGSNIAEITFASCCSQTVVTAPGTATYTVAVANSNGPGIGGLTVAVIELSK